MEIFEKCEPDVDYWNPVFSFLAIDTTRQITWNAFELEENGQSIAFSINFSMDPNNVVILFFVFYSAIFVRDAVHVNGIFYSNTINCILVLIGVHQNEYHANNSIFNIIALKTWV